MSQHFSNADGSSAGWVSVREASAMLGVAESTLRRWGDAGQVSMKRTLGGHRRFRLRDVANLASSLAQGTALVVAPRSALPRWSVDERELARQEWYARLAVQPAAERMRSLGQRLLGLLIQYINARDEDGRFLEDARTVGETYGREVRNAGMRMRDLVQAYLFFRNTFAQSALPLPGVAQPTDLHETAALQTRISRFMDGVLIGLVAGYETASLPGGED